MYARNPQKYAAVDIGDLKREKAIRDSMHCKPFRYFLEYVAPDMLERYPFVSRGSFAKGALQSKASPSLCVAVSREKTRYKKLEVSRCESNKVSPSIGQFFNLTWHRNLQFFDFDVCVTASLNIDICHYMGDNQLWKFDIDTTQLINYKINSTKCLTIDIKTEKLSMDDCVEGNSNQMWNFGEKDIVALRNWEGWGVDLKTLNSIE